MKGSYYHVLGVPVNATPKEIRSSFRRLAREYHPDANRIDPSAENTFKRISEAYAVLSDATKRSAYDAALQASLSASLNPADDELRGEESEGQFWEEILRIAAELAVQNTPWPVIAAVLVEQGCTRDIAISVAQGVHRKRVEAVRSAAARYALGGAAWIGFGLLITYMTSLTLIWSGALLYGGWRLVVGTWFWLTGKAPSTNPPEGLPDPLTGPDIRQEPDIPFRSVSATALAPLILVVVGLAAISGRTEKSTQTSFRSAPVTTPSSYPQSGSWPKVSQWTPSVSRWNPLFTPVPTSKPGVTPIEDNGATQSETEETYSSSNEVPSSDSVSDGPATAATSTSPSDINPQAEGPSSSSQELGLTWGMTKEQVQQIMGNPSSATSTMWVYDGANVLFDFEGRVSGWMDFDGHLKLLWVEPDPNATPIWLGASQEAVLAAMGTPRSATSLEWTYGTDEVLFDYQGRVSGWLNHGGNLRLLQVTPDPNATPIWFGANQDAVATAMGTPQAATNLEWIYGTDEVLFDYQGRVSGWLNHGGSLKLLQVAPDPDAPPIWFGASRDAVSAAMGTPQAATSLSWTYGRDEVLFDHQGRVSGWLNSDGSLQVAQLLPKVGSPPIRVGASQAEVLDTMGTPEAATSMTWTYGRAQVIFDFRGHVSGWLNSDGTLRVEE